MAKAAEKLPKLHAQAAEVSYDLFYASSVEHVTDVAPRVARQWNKDMFRFLSTSTSSTPVGCSRTESKDVGPGARSACCFCRCFLFPSWFARREVSHKQPPVAKAKWAGLCNHFVSAFSVLFCGSAQVKSRKAPARNHWLTWETPCPWSLQWEGRALGLQPAEQHHIKDNKRIRSYISIPKKEAHTQSSTGLFKMESSSNSNP